MIVCEKVNVNQLIENKLLNSMSDVGDTLLVFRKNDIDTVLNKFNRFNKNLKFTVDTFGNCVPHFLDIEICPNGHDIYHKKTPTLQFTNMTLWKWKRS